MSSRYDTLSHNVARVVCCYLIATFSGAFAVFADSGVPKFVFCGVLLLSFLLSLFSKKDAHRRISKARCISRKTERANQAGDGGRTVLASASAAGVGLIANAWEGETSNELLIPAVSFASAFSVLIFSWQLQKAKALSREYLPAKVLMNLNRKMSAAYFANETYDVLAGSLVMFGMSYWIANLTR